MLKHQTLGRKKLFSVDSDYGALSDSILKSLVNPPIKGFLKGSI